MKKVITMIALFMVANVFAQNESHFAVTRELGVQSIMNK